MLQCSTMKLAIMLNAQTDWKATDAHALALLAALLKAKHEIVGVFFYGLSVQVVTDTDMCTHWLDILDHTNTPIIACSTMLEQHNLTATGEKSGFSVAGMASWVNWCEQADRIVEVA